MASPAHDVRGTGSDGLTRTAQESTPLETAIGLALIVISAIEIAWIVRIVQANMRGV